MPLVWRMAKLIGIIVLPFFLLIRGSVFVHKNYNYGAYPSVFIAAVATIILLLYISFLDQKLSRDRTEINLNTRFFIAVALVTGYTIYGLYFISSKNIQNPALKKELNQMHPILRLGVSTFILMDKKMIITDASRKPEDYRKMGLPTNKSSLHYRQKDGYAYAVDLHTSTRNEIRNQLMRLYFNVLGYKTLRHGGTGDHLHVSLYCNYHPKSY